MIRLSALGANLLLGVLMSGRALSLAEFYYLSLYFLTETLKCKKALKLTVTETVTQRL